MIKNALALCNKNGKFLFEVLPDYFPQGQLTQVEVGLWGLFYDDLKARGVIGGRS